MKTKHSHKGGILLEIYQYSPEERKLLEAMEMPFSVFQYVDGKIVTILVSDGMISLFHHKSREDAIELLNNDIYRDTHPADIKAAQDVARDFVEKDARYSVFFRIKIDGQYHIIHSHGIHEYKEGGVKLAIVWYSDEGPYRKGLYPDETGINQYLNRMIDERHQVRNASYDNLTGLPTMFYFFELAEHGRKRYIKEGYDPVMLFIDMNGMKHFNQKYGLTEGDELIKATANLLATYFGKENCGRVGGDHFAVYTVSAGIDNKLRDFFNLYKNVNDGKNVPLRVGIYSNSIEDVSASIACDRAKMASDQKKDVYKSRIEYFNAKLLKKFQNRQYIIDNIDKALEEKWIQVYYQPIIRAANGRVCDEEALARWMDPVKGMLSPADFIPILEDTRLIYKLDLYMLDSVLEKMKEQTERGLFLVPVSINVSRADFDSCDIVEEIRSRVDDAGIARDKITVEITESAICFDFDFMKYQIGRFKELGFKVWLDDFGSGYSSPDMLQKISFDLLKLDMVFMKEFDEDENRRIILTEMVKMAMALGLDTVSEGVEKPEQVDFLKEIGCTKLQGYYYCKPVPKEEIWNRYDDGLQIGFENPDETGYYSEMGKVNLYDFTLSADDQTELGGYFDTMPMVILEVYKDGLRTIRGNKTYREFVDNHFPALKNGILFKDYLKGPGALFVKAVRQCAEDGKRSVVDERTSTGHSMHLLIRKISDNPVTGSTSVVVTLLEFTEKNDKSKGLNYTYIARALSSDYINLYFVDLDDEKYIEYSPDDGNGDLSIERHGKHFFDTCRRESKKYLYPDDIEKFLEAFTKENVLDSFKDNGTFTLTCRFLNGGNPIYVSLKAVKLHVPGNKAVIGINNVDTEMRKQIEYERIKEERITFSRINALSGNYICIYTVDPSTGHYSEYSSKAEYDLLGMSKEGDNFFDNSVRDSSKTIYFEDLVMFRTMFTRQRVLQTIEQSGIFIMNYRMIFGDEPVFVCLKAVMIDEKDGPRLIVGVSNIDDQVKRDQMYAKNLSAARDAANIDPLTGVKNKHAYIDVETQLNELIDGGAAPKFAIVVFDINGLKNINDTKGHNAGDDYIKEGCGIICDLFSHSPVFRIGGDEFVAIIQGSDYDNADGILSELEKINIKNGSEGRPVIASGMYRFNNERKVSLVFEKADKIMYANKNDLKAQKA